MITSPRLQSLRGGGGIGASAGGGGGVVTSPASAPASASFATASDAHALVRSQVLDGGRHDAEGKCARCRLVNTELFAARYELNRVAFLLMCERRRAEEAEARFRLLVRSLEAAAGGGGVSHANASANASANAATLSSSLGAALASQISLGHDASSALASLEQRRQQVRQNCLGVTYADAGASVAGLVPSVVSPSGLATTAVSSRVTAANAASTKAPVADSPLSKAALEDQKDRAKREAGGKGGASKARDVRKSFQDDAEADAVRTLSQAAGEAGATGRKRRAPEEEGVDADADADSAASSTKAKLRRPTNGSSSPSGSGGSDGGGASGSSISRRGDPRMNRAVAAKLENPFMSLLDALLAGGFVFPTNPQGNQQQTQHQQRGGGGNGGGSSSASDEYCAASDLQKNVGTNDKSIVDFEGVSLYQRKNQLNRRLRRAKEMERVASVAQDSAGTRGGTGGNGEDLTSMSVSVLGAADSAGAESSIGAPGRDPRP